jgi:hypothetical protein
LRARASSVTIRPVEQPIAPVRNARKYYELCVLPYRAGLNGEAICIRVFILPPLRNTCNTWPGTATPFRAFFVGASQRIQAGGQTPIRLARNSGEQAVFN